MPDALNLAVPVPAGYRPRGLALCGGVSLGGLLSAHIVNSGLFVPDEFTVELDAAQLPSQYDVQHFAMSQGDVVIDLYIGYLMPGTPSTPSAMTAAAGALGPPLLSGLVEHFEWHVDDGKVELKGRDLSARMTEAKSAEKFPNMVSSQIASTLAARHGLTANVKTTSTAAGIYYDQDQARLTSQHSEWELLCFLAQKEKFNVWVSGHTLNFQPVPDPATAAAWIVQLPPSGAYAGQRANILFSGTARLSRSFLIARDVKVTVSSWDSAKKKKHSKTATSKAKASAGGNQTSSAQASHKPQVYSYNIPGLTEDQAAARAAQIAEDITRHEKVIDLPQPGDSRLTAQTLIRVQGTGTEFDQVYYPDQIDRHLTLADGYVMQIRAKNHAPRTTTVV